MNFQAANRASASLTDVILETHRKKHMAFLMADLGVLVDRDSRKQITRDVRNWQFASIANEWGPNDRKQS